MHNPSRLFSLTASFKKKAITRNAEKDCATHRHVENEVKRNVNKRRWIKEIGDKRIKRNKKRRILIELDEIKLFKKRNKNIFHFSKLNIRIASRTITITLGETRNTKIKFGVFYQHMPCIPNSMRHERA